MPRLLQLAYIAAELLESAHPVNSTNQLLRVLTQKGGG